MKRFLMICILALIAITVKAQSGWLNYAGAKNYAMWTTKWLQADNAFYWKGDTINKGLLVYADLKTDSIRFKRIGGVWSGWYYSGRSGGTYTLPTASATIKGGIKVGSGLSIDAGTAELSVTGGSGISLTDLSATSPINYNNTTGAFSMVANAYAPYGTISFPGFGTSHSLAAYGDHNHTGTYDNYNSWGISVNGGASAGAVSSGNIVNIYGSGGITTSRLGNDITITGGGGSMVYPGSGIPLSTGSAWGTSITNNSDNWNTAYSNMNKVALNTSPTSGDYLNSSWFTAGANGYVPVVDTYVTNGEAAPVSSNAVYDELVLKANLSGATFTGAIYGTTANFSEVYRGYSDIRLKENIMPIKSDISKIRFYQFEMKSDTTNRKRYGVIAQEVQKYMPELIGHDNKGMLTVNYEDLFSAKIDNLESEVKTLQMLVFVLFGLIVLILSLGIIFKK